MKKTSIRLAAVVTASLALAAAANAAPFLAIGDGAELFATGTLGVRADDNIFLSNNATSDVIFDITPGLEFTFGKDGQVKGSLTLVDAFSNYTDHSDLNTDLFSTDFVAGYSDGKMKLDFAAGYHELNQNTVDTAAAAGGTLTRRDVSNVHVGGEVEVSEITSVSLGYTYVHTNYKRSGYGDSDDTTVPLNFYYKMTPKLDLSAGYQYRNFQTQIGQDSVDHFFNVGARGEFTPLLSGTVRIGYTKRTFDRGNDESLLGVDGSLTYALTPKTNVQMTISNQPDTSPQGQQQKNFSVGASVTSNVSDVLKLTGGLSYRAIDYLTRTDDYLEGNLGATYIVNAYVNLIGAYAYRHNSSVINSSEFTNNVFSLAANIRY